MKGVSVKVTFVVPVGRGCSSPGSQHAGAKWRRSHRIVMVLGCSRGLVALMLSGLTAAGCGDDGGAAAGNGSGGFPGSGGNLGTGFAGAGVGGALPTSSGASALGGGDVSGGAAGSSGSTGLGGSVGGTNDGGAGGTALPQCSLPSCLVALGASCTPSGQCSVVEDLETGDKTVTYANDVRQVSVLDVTDYSTTLAVTHGDMTCLTTHYIANDFFNAADDLTVQNGAGAVIATVAMDLTAESYLITCTGAETVSVSRACDDTWPLSGLTTLPSSACFEASTGGAGGAGGTSGASGMGGSGGANSGGTSAGGMSAGGTAATGGSGAGGSGGATNDSSGVRAIMPMDRDWLFLQGDPAGAEQDVFADSDWRPINVPHDWSIEGPFSESAPTTGRGGYVPAGVAWYRKHFTLPEGLSGKDIYIEFDGVMENSTVYLNGVALGTHPYGYVSFRYDMTDSARFGTAENVLAVKTDTSLQPNSRYYAGSGIYRHVRLIATHPVHIAQWATHVTTPQPTAASATVHVQTTVVNNGATAADVTVQGIVSDPSGAALAPVSSSVQSIAPGASGGFSFDVAVSGPQLWSPDSPSLYRLVAAVQIDGVTVDDDETTFGIRSLTFDPSTGLSINGVSTKLRGACLHQDYHGLGLAAPGRAMQRRLAQLKLYGVNAVRTAHDPPSPGFLDLCDRMGILVMDEFFDVWTGHKYADVGDYATYFNQTATSPTGMPAVPDATGSPKWYEVDVTGIVMRDRNHPSLVIYSAGNEIRESIDTRTPILTRMLAIVHALDPERPVTQGLFRPLDSGDVTGATRTLLDVFGGNYRSDEVLQGMQTEPAHAGVFTEMGTQTSTWAVVTSNPGLIGSFMWTGVDYLGESDGGWPAVGADFGMLDAMGTPKAIAFSWQNTWGLPQSTFSTGAVAGSVVLTADHTAITTDLDDASFVRAAVPTATAAVTFAIAGPGAIIAVDSGSQMQESFRGNTRNAYGGLAFAIVQATGPGTITVSATSPGLTAATATIEATEGRFVPCGGTCD